MNANDVPDYFELAAFVNPSYIHKSEPKHLRPKAKIHQVKSMQRCDTNVRLKRGT